MEHTAQLTTALGNLVPSLEQNQGLAFTHIDRYFNPKTAPKHFLENIKQSKEDAIQACINLLNNNKIDRPIINYFTLNAVFSSAAYKKSSDSAPLFHFLTDIFGSLDKLEERYFGWFFSPFFKNFQYVLNASASHQESKPLAQLINTLSPKHQTLFFKYFIEAQNSWPVGNLAYAELLQYLTPDLQSQLIKALAANIPFLNKHLSLPRLYNLIVEGKIKANIADKLIAAILPGQNNNFSHILRAHVAYLNDAKDQKQKDRNQDDAMWHLNRIGNTNAEIITRLYWAQKYLFLLAGVPIEGFTPLIQLIKDKYSRMHPKQNILDSTIINGGYAAEKLKNLPKKPYLQAGTLRKTKQIPYLRIATIGLLIGVTMAAIPFVFGFVGILVGTSIATAPTWLIPLAVVTAFTSIGITAFCTFAPLIAAMLFKIANFAVNVVRYLFDLAKPKEQKVSYVSSQQQVQDEDDVTSDDDISHAAVEKEDQLFLSKDAKVGSNAILLSHHGKFKVPCDKLLRKINEPISICSPKPF